MARGRKGTGVELRATHIRIRFTWNGTRYAEPTDLAPSIANEKAAKRIALDVQREIAAGVFDWDRFRHYFPNSKNIPAEPVKDKTFDTYAKLWLKGRSGVNLADWTQSKDANYVKFWTEKFGATTDLRKLLPSFVEATVATHEWPSNKHRNNLLTSLRGIFALAMKDRVIEIDPAADIKNGPVQKKKPDPWSMAEAELILEDMRKHYDVRVWSYYEHAFFAGERPEEQIILKWTKLDATHRTILVDEAKTNNGKIKPIKTNEARLVELNSRAFAAIERMRPWTQLKPHGCIFENPRTGLPWASEADQRDLYWNPTIKRLRLRHRVAYSTRSTCATMYLMAGRKPGWIADQLGHSVRVFFDVYADWINRADNGREMAAFEAELAKMTAATKTEVSNG